MHFNALTTIATIGIVVLLQLTFAFPLEAATTNTLTPRDAAPPKPHQVRLCINAQLHGPCDTFSSATLECVKLPTLLNNKVTSFEIKNGPQSYCMLFDKPDCALSEPDKQPDPHWRDTWPGGWMTAGRTPVMDLASGGALTGDNQISSYYCWEDFPQGAQPVKRD
ncbi:hypothetical protein Vi05172_g3466 [Venturia inaequalis]|nr:hypothetical protein Vi05172_g3466 [Venturia inaequalis]